jgi:hypothetical protein
MSKKKGDGFSFACFVWLGLCIPLLCFYEAWRARIYGFSLYRAALYNVLRIGPMYVHFAHVYTLCHKEYHTYAGVFNNTVNSLGGCWVFNWWTGLFYGK